MVNENPNMELEKVKLEEVKIDLRNKRQSRLSNR